MVMQRTRSRAAASPTPPGPDGAEPERTVGRKLDWADRMILRILQTEGRISYAQLAQQVGLSQPAILRRVRVLESMDVIRGYYAEIADEAIGYPITAWVLVELESQGGAELTKFQERAIEWPMVRQCELLAGDFDFLLKIVARTREEYERFYMTTLATAPGVSRIKSWFGMKMKRRAADLGELS